MKKIYTKPSLLAERFAVEDIMTEGSDVIATAFSGVRSVYFGGNEIGGTISFTTDNIHIISYDDFKA